MQRIGQATVQSVVIRGVRQVQITHYNRAAARAETVIVASLPFRIFTYGGHREQPNHTVISVRPICTGPVFDTVSRQLLKPVPHG